MVQLSRLVRRIFSLGSMLFACLLLMGVFASSSAFAATSPQPHYKFKRVTPAAGLAPHDYSGPCLYVTSHVDIPWDFNPGEYNLSISFGTTCTGQTLQGVSAYVSITSNCGGQDSDVGGFSTQAITFSSGLHLAYDAGRGAACLVYGNYPPFTEHLSIQAYGYNQHTGREETALKTTTISFQA